MTSDADVVVVGGGPAGAAAGLGLARQGARVWLVERSRYGARRFGESLPPEIRPALAALGVDHDLAGDGGHLPSWGVRSVWGHPEPMDREFLFSPYGNGWHVDRRAFDAALARAAEERGVRVARGARPVARMRRAGRWRLELAGDGAPRTLTARFLIDATGRPAALARSLGARRILSDRLVAVYAILAPRPGSAPERQLTLVEAAEFGWWYSAPLPAGRLAVAGFTDTDLCRAHRLTEPRRWREHLAHAPHTSSRARAFRFDGAHRVLACDSSRLEPSSGPGWLAVGDAAAAWDPISGNGVYRALTTGREAAAAVMSSLGGDPAPLAALHGALADSFRAYLLRRNAFYSREKRWLDAPFWARRRGAARGLLDRRYLTQRVRELGEFQVL